MLQQHEPALAGEKPHRALSLAPAQVVDAAKLVPGIRKILDRLDDRRGTVRQENPPDQAG
jgi:hypothetical protein